MNDETSEQQTVNIGLLNVQGLVTKQRNKLNEDEVTSLTEKCDIVLLTETWTNEQTDIQLDGYFEYKLSRKRHKRAKRDSGGLAIFIREKLKKEVVLVKCDSDDIMWIRIDGSLLPTGKALYICLTYVLPKGSSRTAHVTENVYDRIMLHMAEFEQQNQSEIHFLVAGDCNAHTRSMNDWVESDDYDNSFVPLPDFYIDDFSFPIKRASKDNKQVCSNGNQLLDFCKTTGLRIVNGRIGDDRNNGDFTYYDRHGGSVIDYFISSQDLFSLLTNFSISPPTSFTDHCMLLLEINCTRSLQCVTNVEHDTTEHIVRSKIKWSKELNDLFVNNIRQCSNNLDNIITRCEENGECTEDTISNFTNILIDTVPKELLQPIYKQTNRQKKRDPEWMCEMCRIKRSEFFSSVNILKRCNNSINRKTMVEKRRAYNIHKKRCRNAYSTMKTKEFVTAKKKNSSDVWRLLSCKKKQPVPDISTNSFYEHFRDLNKNTCVNSELENDINMYNKSYDEGKLEQIYDELNVQINNKEVLEAINNLKLDKSGGDDMLVNEIFIYGKDIIVPLLSRIFNCILVSGNFPSSWSKGIIVPIFKSGDINSVTNYRGITLLSVFGKLFTSIINNRLSKWAEDHKLFFEGQAGFRKNYSTIDNIFLIQCMVERLLDRGKKLFCCFVDYKKAFDLVNHDCLWYKLLKLGIRGHIINIIKSMYENIVSVVKDPSSQAYSKEITCKIGVRQGECLSPFLFAMYVNDLETKLSEKVSGVEIFDLKMFLLLYADDAVIFSDSVNGLQDSLNVLSQYCKRWKLHLNTDKTKVLVFKRGGRSSKQENWSFDGRKLEVVKAIKYLGITLSQNGSFIAHFSAVAEKARKASFALLKRTNQFRNLSPIILYDLYCKTIIPILCYGCEIWGFSDLQIIERVHLWFCKLILKVKSTTMSELVYCELATSPIKNLVYVRILKYWFKLLCCENDRYIAMFYSVMKEENAQNDWVRKVKSLLFNHGFGYVWEQQNRLDKETFTSFLSEFKCRIQDEFFQNNMERFRTAPKARLYKELYIKHEIPWYLENVNCVYRHYLTKLRLGSHYLISETGSWSRPKITYAERKCVYCNVLGDEYHHILECTKFVELRKKYVPKYYYVNPSMFKFVDLLLCKKKKVQNNLCIYIRKSFLES